MDQAEDQERARDQRRPLLDGEADELRRLIQRPEGTVDHDPLRGRLRFTRGRCPDPFTGRGGGAGTAGFAGFGGLAVVPASRRAFVVTFRPGCAPPDGPGVVFAARACPPCGGPVRGFGVTFGAAREEAPGMDRGLLAGARPPARPPGVPGAATLAGVLPVALLLPVLFAPRAAPRAGAPRADPPVALRELDAIAARASRGALAMTDPAREIRSRRPPRPPLT